MLFWSLLIFLTLTYNFLISFKRSACTFSEELLSFVYLISIICDKLEGKPFIFAAWNLLEFENSFHLYSKVTCARSLGLMA